MKALHALMSQLRTLCIKHKSRRDLARRLHNINSHELDALVRDVGIPHSVLLEEANRPLWAASPLSDEAESVSAAERSKSPMPPVRALRT